MSGVAHGCSNLFTSQDDSNSARYGQVIFKSIYEVVVNHPSASIETIFYGNTGATGDGDGLGTGYWWEANSFRGGAFFLVKMPANSNRDFDYWWLCQYRNGTESGNQTPVTWQGGATGNGAIGFAACAVSGGAGNPWNGTINLSGSAAKGNPVWNVSGSTVLILPHSNMPGGAHAASRQNLIYTLPGAETNTNQFTHFAMDDDTFVMAPCTTGYGVNESLLFGHYHSSIIQSGSNQLWMYSSMVTSVVMGLESVVPSTAGGIIVAITGSNYVFQAVPTTDTQIRSIASNYLDGHLLYNKRIEQNINLWSGTTNNQGFAGTFGGIGELFGFAYKTHPESINAEETRAYFGRPAYDEKKLGIPWTGGPPGASYFSRTGSFF